VELTDLIALPYWYNDCGTMVMIEV